METINDLTQYKFGNIQVPLKTSIAWNGDARSDDDFHEVTLLVDLSGVLLKDFTQKALAQKAVEFQRPRRAKSSGGVFESRDKFDEYCEQIGSEHVVHFNSVGKAPTQPMTDEEAQAQADQSISQMSPEALAEYAKKVEQLAKQKQGG